MHCAFSAPRRALDGVGFPTPGILLRNAGGRSLGESSTGQALADGTVSQTLSRADLYRVMHDEAAPRGNLDRARQAAGGGRGTRRRVSVPPSTMAPPYVATSSSAPTGWVSTVRTIIDPGAPAPAYSA